MHVIDQLLNIGALLLWYGWRASGFACAGPPALVNLTALLRPARRSWYHRSAYLAALGGLLVFRTWLYWQLGAEVQWVAILDLTVLKLPFKSASFGLMALYSAGSFLVALGVLYTCLLLLSVVNRRLPQTDPLQRQVRLHLGRVECWPALLRLTCPGALAASFWGLLSPWLAALGLIERPPSAFVLCQQTLVFGAVVYLAWEYLLLGLLFVHFVNSYVYLGPGALWGYATDTARNLLGPLRGLPLRLGKVDLAPLVGLAIVYWGFGWARGGLRLLYDRLPL